MLDRDDTGSNRVLVPGSAKIIGVAVRWGAKRNKQNANALKPIVHNHGHHTDDVTGGGGGEGVFPRGYRSKQGRVATSGGTQ